MTLLDGLYWEKTNTNPNVTKEETYIYNENKLLGVPRLRQLKVRKDSCTVHEDFKSEISECYDVYSEKEEEIDPFGLENGTAYVLPVCPKVWHNHCCKSEAFCTNVWCCNLVFA